MRKKLQEMEKEQTRKAEFLYFMGIILSIVFIALNFAFFFRYLPTVAWRDELFNIAINIITTTVGIFAVIQLFKTGRTCYLRAKTIIAALDNDSEWPECDEEIPIAISVSPGRIMMFGLGIKKSEEQGEEEVKEQAE